MADNTLILFFVAELDDDDEDNQNTYDAESITAIVASSTARQEKIKISGYVDEVVPQYLLDDFKRFFRVTRTTFETICENIQMYQVLLPSWTGGREHIPIFKQLLIVLWYVASQETLNRIADRFDIAEVSVVRCRNRVFHVFLTYLKTKFITWPQEGVHRQEVLDGFERKANFPGVLGAIDGTHIKIKAPKQHPETYVNRKGYHSVILQAVCREDMRFTHVVAGSVGSCHDARVLRTSDLWENGPARCGDAHIIGDAAYPLRNWLLTPYRDNGHLTPTQRHYNTCLSTTRVTVERAFGVYKGRFRRLQYVDTHKVETAVDLIIVCCILHNICILNEDEMIDYFEDDNAVNHNPLPRNQAGGNAEANAKRDNIANSL